MADSEGSKRIAVVGAGVMGLSCALELSSLPGVEVTVIERGYPGDGSTSRSAGVYTRQYLTYRDVELRARSIERIYALEAEGAIKLRRIGFIRVGRDAAAEAAFRRSVELQGQAGVSDPGRVIGPDELAELVPHYDRDGVESCLYAPSEGYVDGAELCTALAERVQANGGQIMVRAGLRGCRRDSAGRFLLDTERGEVTAERVVNCAGAWAEKVGEILEAPIAMTSERHEAFIFELPKAIDYQVPMLMDYVPGGEEDEGLYFRHEGESQLVAGVHTNDILSGDDLDEDDFFEGVTEDGTARVVRLLANAFPGVEEIGLRGGWAGLYPHCSDGRAVAGPHPDDPAVLVGAGLGGVGLSLGPVMGKLLAEWIEFGEPRSIRDANDMVPTSVS